MLAFSRFLTQREIQLKNRRKEAEKLLENQKKMVEWKKRLDEEDKQVRNLLNQALNLNNATSPTQPQTGQSLTPGEEEERGRQYRNIMTVSFTSTSYWTQVIQAVRERCLYYVGKYLKLIPRSNVRIY